MSIQQYYQQTAYANLNGSIVSAGILSLILTAGLLFSWNVPFVLVAGPFLFVCLFYYNKYLLYQTKSDESMDSSTCYDDKGFLEQSNLLLAFAPAPAVKLLFFTPDGMLAGEISEINAKKWRWFLPYFIDRRLKKNFGVFDARGKLLARMIQEGKRMKLLNHQGEIIGFYYPEKLQKGKLGTAIVKNGKKLSMNESSGFTPEIILKDEKNIVFSKLQKGWMPLEWSRYFIDTQTPALSFDYSLDQGERMAVFAALAQRYMYHDH